MKCGTTRNLKLWRSFFFSFRFLYPRPSPIALFIHCEMWNSHSYTYFHFIFRLSLSTQRHYVYLRAGKHLFSTLLCDDLFSLWVVISVWFSLTKTFCIFRSAELMIKLPGIYGTSFFHVWARVYVCSFHIYELEWEWIYFQFRTIFWLISQFSLNNRRE